MIVETHAFKTAFIQGDAIGFVVCAHPPSSSPARTAKPVFAEIYGLTGCYHIFEDRTAAEAQIARFPLGTPTCANLAVLTVSVESVRDYQRLAGVKTVFLIDRSGLATQSLRVGDMPLPARVHIPFPSPVPAGVSLVYVDSPPGYACSSPALALPRRSFFARLFARIFGGR